MSDCTFCGDHEPTCPVCEGWETWAEMYGWPMTIFLVLLVLLAVLGGEAAFLYLTLACAKYLGPVLGPLVAMLITVALFFGIGSLVDREKGR